MPDAQDTLTARVTAATPIAAAEPIAGPWYRQVTRDQWRAFWAVFLGWVVDSFDFNILTFILIDIRKEFSVGDAAAGALGTVTLIMRLVGGSIAGTASDRWGRKLPLTLSILWFSLFAFVSGFSTSYAMLFAFRALFGLGMGGEWAAGMPLVIEHWPARLRGFVSGLMLGGWYWGYLLAAMAFHFIYPLFNETPDLAWRSMFWVAIVPALFTLWIRARVPESPIWLERQRQLRDAPERAKKTVGERISFLRLFYPDLILTTLQTTLVIGAFMCIYYSLNYWYPTLHREAGRDPLGYLVAFNLGAIAGTLSWGSLSQTRLGRRGAVTITVLMGMVSLPLYLHATETSTMVIGALMMGFFGMGVWGMAPAYAVERFPAEVRGAGPGFCYHAAAAIGAFMPALLGMLKDRGLNLVNSMSTAMVIAGAAAIVLIWLGPETRGKQFAAE
jgi:SHS family lactate transporter-like MFS transporter